MEDISIHGKMNVGKECHWFHCRRVGRFDKIPIQTFLHIANLIGYLVCSSESGRLWKVKKTCNSHYLAQQRLLPQLTKAGIMRLKALNNEVSEYKEPILSLTFIFIAFSVLILTIPCHLTF